MVLLLSYFIQSHFVSSSAVLRILLCYAVSVKHEGIIRLLIHQHNRTLGGVSVKTTRAGGLFEGLGSAVHCRRYRGRDVNNFTGEKGHRRASYDRVLIIFHQQFSTTIQRIDLQPTTPKQQPIHTSSQRHTVQINTMKLLFAISMIAISAVGEHLTSV